MWLGLYCYDHLISCYNHLIYKFTNIDVDHVVRSLWKYQQAEDVMAHMTISDDFEIIGFMQGMKINLNMLDAHLENCACDINSACSGVRRW